jgi:probable F420-dependent oxidoreductase
VRIGFHLPQWDLSATREGVMHGARTIEAAGLDSVWVGDHVVWPAQLGSDYPYKDRLPVQTDRPFLEALTVLTFAAAVTERVTLGTSVMVLPQRETLLTAKTIATLDVLSGGRTLLAVGAGWLEAEFAALGQPFAGRGRRMDEQIAALRMLWGEGRGASSGDHVRFAQVICEPRPLQPGGPRILIGGMGQPAFRRVARCGDGWHAVGSRTDVLAAGMAEIARLAERGGRDPAALRLSTSIDLVADEERMLGRLARLAEAGVDHVVLHWPADEVDEWVRAVEQFAERVLPRVRATLG